MTQTRIYVPMDMAMLRRLAQRKEIGSAPVPAHAVTERLKRSLPNTGEEEQEYAALRDAVAAASELAGPGNRRVVVAADVDSDGVRAAVEHSSQPLSRVEVGDVVPLRRVVSLHVDDVAGKDDEELLWYDVTELGEVIRSL